MPTQKINSDFPSILNTPFGNFINKGLDIFKLNNILPPPEQQQRDMGNIIYGAYKSGDALGGAMSGWQLGASLGTKFGPWGAAAGLLAGLFSKGVDRWQRPKFKDSKEAFDKLFTMDRGERNDYYMPDSFYFRGGGGNIPRNIVVKINDKKFDEHVRESLTNNYAAQLQRGLVF